MIVLQANVTWSTQYQASLPLQNSTKVNTVLRCWLFFHPISRNTEHSSHLVKENSPKLHLYKNAVVIKIKTMLICKKVLARQFVLSNCTDYRQWQINRTIHTQWNFSSNSHFLKVTAECVVYFWNKSPQSWKPFTLQNESKDMDPKRKWEIWFQFLWQDEVFKPLHFQFRSSTSHIGPYHP